MRKILKNNTLYFLLVLILVSLFYYYPKIVLKRPESVHKWRQSDCTSLALNYYQNGMNFFQPQTHNFTSDNDTSGYCATSEIPFVYYFVAILYKIFGYHDFIYRLFNTLIFYLGLFYLFKLFFKVLDNSFYSITAVILFFASPVIAYYGNNYLTDSTALSLAFVALYHFYKFYKEKSILNYLYSILFYFLAGSCKISALISFVAIMSIFFLDIVSVTKLGLKEMFFKNKVKIILPLILLVGIILSWILYAKYYNKIHGSGYFSTSILPIWSLDKKGIDDILYAMGNLWLNQYFHPYTLILLGFMLICNLICIKTKETFLYLANLFVFIGAIVYSLLWFSTYNNHDYYLLNLYILPIITILLFLSNIQKFYPKVLNSLALKIVFSAFLLFNVYHTSRILRVRYVGWFSDPTYHSFQTVTPYLHSIGVKDLDTVICLPDYTHASLYNMNLRGWTNCLGASNDSISFERNIRNGAKYIIINDDISKDFPFAMKYLTNQIGEYQNIKIYKVLSK